MNLLKRKIFYLFYFRPFWTAKRVDFWPRIINKNFSHFGHIFFWDLSIYSIMKLLKGSSGQKGDLRIYMCRKINKTMQILILFLLIFSNEIKIFKFLGINGSKIMGKFKFLNSFLIFGQFGYLRDFISLIFGIFNLAFCCLVNNFVYFS